jgi:hypothetical protein
MNMSFGSMRRAGRLAGPLVALAAAGVVLTSCGGAGKVVSVKAPADTPTTSTTEPTTTAPNGSLPNLPPPPDLTAAQKRVKLALGTIQSAAARVTATAATPELQRLANAMNKDLVAVVNYRDQAIAAGKRGDCARTFAAARHAKGAYKAVVADVGAIHRQVGTTGDASAAFNKARGSANESLQTLFNAIAGNPLEAGRSSAVDELRAAMATGQIDARDAAGQVRQMLKDASAIRKQAKTVSVDAAFAVCAEVSSGSN